MKASVSASAVRLTFTNTGDVGAVFHVYDKHFLDAIPHRFAVGRGKSLSHSFTPRDDGAYDLFVLGPNGYHRAFVGIASSESADRGLELEVKYDPEASRMRLRCTNSSSAAVDFVLADRAYGLDGTGTFAVPRGERIDVWFDLSPSGRWYDFELTAPSAPSFRRRVAGRMENGDPSISDPAMGQL